MSGDDVGDVSAAEGEAGRPRQSQQLWIADGASDGIRVDVFLARQLGVSAARARHLWGEGAVRVNGHRVAKGARLTAGASVAFQRGAGAAAAETVAPEGTEGASTGILADPAVPITILYEDEHLVAIDKPAGIPSHPLRAGERGTAANALVARFPECAWASHARREAGLGHRLDTGTSGVLIAARSQPAWEALRQALAAATCEKSYLAEVKGHPAATGLMTAAIGRTGRRGGTVRLDGGRRPQAAETRWSVLAQGAATALVLAQLHRGRAHQVRAHLAAAGFPIVGDTRYGGGYGDDDDDGSADARVDSRPDGSGFRLHALSVRLRHPMTGDELTIVAPRPPWAHAANAPDRNVDE